MALIESIAAMLQDNGTQPAANPPAAGYFIVAILAVVVGFMAWIFIRTSARRSSKQ
jgi:hypothetical protein